MRIRDWYFQGWERRTDERGQSRLVYAGEVYRFPGGLAAVRRPAVWLAAALIALYIPLSLLPSDGGMWHYAAIPQLLEIIPLVYLLIGAVCLLRAKEPLTFRDWYASWRRMSLAARWSAGFAALMAAVEIAYLLLAAEAPRLDRELPYLLGELALLALSIALTRYIRTHPASPSVERTENE